MPDMKMPAGVAEAAVACMRTTAELQTRLTAGWFDLMMRGTVQPPAIAAWSLEALRLAAEATLRNIEHCQDCVRNAAADAP